MATMTTVSAKFLQVDGSGVQGALAVSLERLGLTDNALVNTAPLVYPLVSGEVEINLIPSVQVGSRYRFQLQDTNGLPTDFSALLDIPDSETTLELSDLIPNTYFDVQEANINRIVAKVLEQLGNEETIAGVESFQGRSGVVVAQQGDYGISMITGLQNALDNKSPSSHTHSQYVTGDLFTSELANKANVNHTHNYLAVSGTPQDGYVPKIVSGVATWSQDAQGTGGASGVSSFNGRNGSVTPQADDYNISQVTGLQTALDGKAYSYEVSNALVYFTDILGETSRKKLFGVERVFINEGYDEFTFPDGAVPVWSTALGKWEIKVLP